MMPEDRLTFFFEVARQALAIYGLADAPFEYLQHSENVTFKVSHPDGSARLLRIHVPRVPSMGGHGDNPEVVKSELLWLEALRRETDIPVQQPIRNRREHLVTRITIDGERQFNCSLLQWLEGQPYQREYESEFTVAQMGTIIAKMHRFNGQWRLPAGYTRPRRDGLYFKRALQALMPAVEDKRIDYQDYKRLEESVTLLTKTMQSLPKTRQTDGVLHGDLHKGNFLYQHGQIRLIDFSMCSIGNFMLDLGICFSDMNPALFPAFLESYQHYTPLPPNYPFLIEAFFLGSMVASFSFWIDLPEVQDEFVRKVPLIAQEYATKFNRGERFWFTS
jgi:Ser/Thr protein kinase RdoA (MazF antagonist)